MKGFFDEFKKFILRGNVVDLAVGIVIGAAFGRIVDSMVKDLFMPIVGLLTGGFDVSSQTIHVYGDVNIGWGAFLQAVINFVIIGLCMFLVVKGMNKLHERFMKQEEKPPAEQSPTEKLLIEIRDLLKAQPAPTRHLPE
ncbi:MAG TPA: large conductance mechanosensitive channel protein MscL [Gemmataceae bacterium]|nr:large conductance mechanosensitive channel protein MscL [Gemmataceae bacterium]